MVDATESYDVYIYLGATFKRTITVGVEEALYTAAEQATDGFDEGATIRARVYMVNDEYGRGHVREGLFLIEGAARFDMDYVTFDSTLHTMDEA